MRDTRNGLERVRMKLRRALKRVGKFLILFYFVGNRVFSKWSKIVTRILMHQKLLEMTNVTKTQWFPFSFIF